MTTFINTSKTAISAALQKRLDEGTHIIRAQLEHDGVPPRDWGKLVGVFLLGSTDALSDYVLIKKENFRAFVKDLQKEAPRKLPIHESTITKCLEDVPAGVMRVLYVSDESCGAMKLFYNESEESMQANLAAKLRDTIAAASAYMNKEQLKLAEDIHERVKHLSPKDALQVVKDAELATSAELAELHAHRAALGEDMHNIILSFVDRLPDFRERWKSVLARAKKVVIPPDAASANNLEVTLMSAAYVFERVTVGTGLRAEEAAFLIGHHAHNEPLVVKLLERMDGGLRGTAFSGGLQDFSLDWMRQGFPKLEVGQKLAASLALTEVPNDIEVLAPWKAWSLIVPPRLFGASKEEGDIARLWCMGTEIKFIVLSKGGVIGQINEEKLAELSEGPGRLLWDAMSSLVKGACLALANPDDYKRQSIKDRSSASKKQRDGEPDFSVSRFMLSAPVQIDLRQTLIDTLEGKKHHGGGAHTVQFFVRGHWRNQAHGPGRTLRKTIRIEGFWKGNQDAAILLRNYRVKDDEEEHKIT